MRILHINKSDVKGGAAVAASRIVNSLRSMDVEASMLVAEKSGHEASVVSIANSRREKAKVMYYFLQEVAAFLPHEKNKTSRFAFSLARRGFNLHKHPLVLEADLIHLHWFNQGFLSLKGLEHIFQLGKPVVWTLHDMWSFTGGCHYAGDCEGYQISCGNCPVIQDPSVNDISALQHLKKQAAYANAPLSIVTCSQWLATVARRSSLLQQHAITSIPNPIDTERYSPIPRQDARKRLQLPLDKKILLFGAANVADPRKGMALLMHALKTLSTRKQAGQIELVIFGKTPPRLEEKLPFPARLMHYVTDLATLVDLYNAADVFVLPSLEDNLPNTVMEALACGTPVAAFRIGGVPEMVAHGICGYLAAPGDADGLAEGIEYLLFKCDEQTCRENARDKVLKNFAPELVALQYLNLYKQLLGEKSRENE
jgi:glycosyltransferase involved in cell wall biosynthesis